MKQSDTINELLIIYRQAEKCNKQNHGTSFYRCLSNLIQEHIGKLRDAEDYLKQYEMSCKSYLESNILNFNISVGAFMISLIALSGMNFNIKGIAISLLFAAFVGGWTIFNHMKDRKLREILFVVEKLKEKICILGLAN